MLNLFLSFLVPYSPTGDGYDDQSYNDKSSDKSSRSSSISQSKTMTNSRWRKPKSCTGSSSTTMKRRNGKNNVRLGEAKWYLETISSMNINSNNTDTTSVSSAKSTATSSEPVHNFGK